MSTKTFLDQTTLLLDARSPSEFLQGHIPGALSFPLFSDDERAQIGTLYKQEGKNVAVKMGLLLVAPKLSSFIEDAKILTGPSKTLRLYCARGGMRSSFLAWWLQTEGFHCTLLTNGYKAFRRWVLDQFKIKYSLLVLGGLTGSGKTDLLLELKKQHEQIINLEEIANHRGSSFGHLGCKAQPSSEHLENILAKELSMTTPGLPLWIEDESRMIGTCHLPEDLWKQMSTAPFLWIDSSKEDRVARIANDYGSYAEADLVTCTERLVKRLGAVRTKEIVQDIKEQKLKVAFDKLLDYYDKTYLYSIQKAEKKRIDFAHTGSNQDLITQLKTFSKNQG